MQCETTITVDKVFDTYGQCPNPAKFRASYKGVRGGRVSEVVCGVHKAAMEKRAISLKKRTGYDPELIIEKLT